MRLTVEQMAWAFEQLDCDVPLKSIALDVGADVSTVSREVYRATSQGFSAWEPRRRGRPKKSACIVPANRLQ